MLTGTLESAKAFILEPLKKKKKYHIIYEGCSNSGTVQIQNEIDEEAVRLL